MRAFAASNFRGTCLWCGRKLHHECATTWESTRGAPAHCRGRHWSGARCNLSTFTKSPDSDFWYCPDGHGNPSRRRVASREHVYGAPGPRGNGFFCCGDCAKAFGLAVAKSGHRLTCGPFAKEPTT